MLHEKSNSDTLYKLHAMFNCLKNMLSFVPITCQCMLDNCAIGKVF